MCSFFTHGVESFHHAVAARAFSFDERRSRNTCQHDRAQSSGDSVKSCSDIKAAAASRLHPCRRETLGDDRRKTFRSAPEQILRVRFASVKMPKNSDRVVLQGRRKAPESSPRVRRPRLGSRARQRAQSSSRSGKFNKGKRASDRTGERYRTIRHIELY
jgi:hypothetical protein